MSIEVACAVFAPSPPQRHTTNDAQQDNIAFPPQYKHHHMLRQTVHCVFTAALYSWEYFSAYKYLIRNDKTRKRMTFHLTPSLFWEELEDRI